MSNTIQATDLDGLVCLHRGKVRDVYEVGDDLLFVATDRVSAYDSILEPAIPDKGRVLTQLSLFWFERLEHLIPHHVITSDVDAMPPAVQKHRAVLEGRTLLVKRLKMLPIECVVRGYLVGSGWRDYQRTGAVCGHTLPEGLSVGARLDPPIFTPATKAEEGHDENITRDQAAALLGKERATEVERLTLALYEAARDLAARRGVVIADTKLEMGYDEDGRLVLGDEAFTPDSSRFWDAREVQAGQVPRSYDKQLVRDWLDGTGWNHEPPAPRLADDVVAQTTATYREIYARLVGDARPL